MNRVLPKWARVNLCAVLLFLAIGASAPPNPPEDPYAIPNADLPKLADAILGAKAVWARHVVTVRKPSPFRTTAPCSLDFREGQFEQRLDPDAFPRLAELLRVEKLRNSKFAQEAPPCPRISGRKDEVFVTFGDNPEAVTAVVSLTTGSVSYAWKHRYGGDTALGTGSRDLRSELVGWMPDDSMIAGARCCDRDTLPIPASPDAPLVGNYQPVDQYPEALEKIPPEYPPAISGRGIEGVVYVQAFVGEDGHVKRTVITQSVPPLDSLAVSAAEKWSFKPASFKGRPVPVWVALPMTFSLK